MTKSALRARILAARKTLPAMESEEASERIMCAVLALPEFTRPRRVALYLSRPGEVETGGLLHALREKGAEVFVPFFRNGAWGFASLDADGLADGPLGTRQPAAPEAVSAASLDLFIVPCVGVDPACGRLGHGKGIYDRLLAHAGGPLIGLAFDFQVMPEVPMEPHDRRLDRVVTESRVFTRATLPGAAG